MRAGWKDSARELAFVGAVVLGLLAVGGSMLGFGVWAVFRGLEDRFGANVAVLVFGGLFVLGAFVGGALFAAQVARQSQRAFLQGLGELGDVMRGTAGVQREALRGEREAFRAAARIETIDAQRVERLADQRARLLLADTRQDQRDAQRAADQAPTWQAQATTPAAQPSGEGRRFRYVE